MQGKIYKNDGTLKKDKRKREFTYEKNLFSGLHEDIVSTNVIIIY